MSLTSFPCCKTAAGSTLHYALSSVLTPPHPLCRSWQQPILLLTVCNVWPHACLSLLHFTCLENFLFSAALHPHLVSNTMADFKDARGARLGSAQLAEITPSEPDHGHACVGKHSGVPVMQGRPCLAQHLHSRCHTCQVP